MPSSLKKSNSIATILKTLPSQPGVYQYYDNQGNILYVGKAINIKKRVSSYFNKEQLSGKLKVLVRKIVDIRIIVVESEIDALLLENNLIKELQPPYNARLKDDKTYPWICIKNENFSRILSTRNIVKDNSLYFGPYASVKMMLTLLDLIRQLYPLRNCSLNLTGKNIIAKKFKVCLEFHLGNCKGPCEGLQSLDNYNENILQIKEIIKGNISSIISQMKVLMMQYANELEFEKAQLVKKNLETLEKYQSKSTIVNPDINNVDVFSIIDDEKSSYINFLKVVKGAIVQSHTVEIQKKIDETARDMLLFAIADLRERFNTQSEEIIVPFDIKIKIPNVKISIPQRGDRKKLLELSERNVKYYKLDKEKQIELVDPERHSKRILAQLMKDLRMENSPEHIECFDNSNTQGTFPVAAMVVFKNAKPSKNDYRHFNIKTVEGPNDYASMEEVIFRRYKRVLEEKEKLPDLIIVDGGKGQLSSALKSLKILNIDDKIRIIGIAKKLEEIYFPNDSIPLYIDKKSESLKLIQQLRDEAHRFGITHHRNKRDKASTQSILSEIESIGYSTSQDLLRKFKSVKNIQSASLEELQKTIGKARAIKVFNFFQTKKAL